MAETIIFKLNNKCNANCIFCEVPLIKKSCPEPSLEINIELLKSMVSGDTKTLVLTGGEPGIYPYIFEFLEHVRNNYKFEDIYLQTNGLILADEKRLDRLLMSGITAIQISFNQIDEKKYDFLLGIKNSLKYIVKGIDNVQKRNVKITVNTVVSKANYQEIPEIIKFLHSKKINNIMISSLNPIGSNVDGNNVPLAAIEYSKVIPYVEKALRFLKDNNERICIKDFPICCFAKEWQNLDYFLISGKVLLDLSFTRVERCKDCKFSDGCLGIRTSYLKLFGDSEFK